MTGAKNRDILKAVRKRRSRGNKIYFGNPEFESKVMTAYFKQVKAIVKEGFEFKFPQDFGTMYIKKKDAKWILRWPSKIAVRKLEDYNLKRFGQSYSYVVEGGFVKKAGYKFKATNIDNKKLFNILIDTDIEFRTNLATQ